MIAAWCLFIKFIFFFAPSQVTVHHRTFSKSVQFAPIIHTSWTSSIALSILCTRFAKRIPRDVKLCFRINKYFQCKRKIAHKILIYTESIFAQKKINPSGQRLWGSVFFFPNKTLLIGIWSVMNAKILNEFATNWSNCFFS